MSDDTEHAAMTTQALLVAGNDERAFIRSLAWRLRGWLAAMPPGIGWATLRAIVRLWIGVPPARSGVRSAGNGPLMRAPILGAALGARPEQLARFVRASTRITHTDPRAEQAALVVAFACAHAGAVSAGGALLGTLRSFIRDEDFRRRFDCMAASLRRRDSPETFAVTMGFHDGVSGFAPDSTCAALFCWLRYPASFRDAVAAVIDLGGDTDTTGAIVGGLAGAALGSTAIPEEWLAGLAEWPRTANWLRQLGAALAAAEDGGPRQTVPLFWPALPLRNLAVLAVAIGHVMRRWVVCGGRA